MQCNTGIRCLLHATAIIGCLQKDENTQAKDLCALQFKVNLERIRCSAGQSLGCKLTARCILTPKSLVPKGCVETYISAGQSFGRLQMEKTSSHGNPLDRRPYLMFFPWVCRKACVLASLLTGRNYYSNACFCNARTSAS